MAYLVYVDALGNYWFMNDGMNVLVYNPNGLRGISTIAGKVKAYTK